MFCTNCGNQMLDGSKFCTKCGAPMGALAPEVPAEGASAGGADAGDAPAHGGATQGAAAAAGPSPAPSKKKRTGLVVGIAAAVVVALAAVGIAVFSELMARLRHCPATSYLLIAMFPLVPGRGIYRTMLYCITGETELFFSTLLHTMGLAGCLAVGAMLVSAVVRLCRSAAALRR